MLSLDEKTTCLRAGIFRHIDTGILANIASRMGERDLQNNEQLFLTGEPGDEIYIVVDGAIEIHMGDYVIAVLEKGALFGEMAVLGGGRRTASGRARGETKLLFLKEKALKILIQQSPDIAFALFKVLIDRLEESNRLARFLAGEKRVHGWLHIESGSCRESKVPLYHAQAALGKSTGTPTADALRIALPSDDPALCEHHASVVINDEGLFLSPLEGEVFVNDDPIADILQIDDNDRVRIGSLVLSFHLEDS